MAGEEEIVRKALLSMFQAKIPLAAAWFKCVSVEDKTCTVLMDEEADLKVPDILLGFDLSGCVVKPVVNKDVLVLFAENSKQHGAVIMCEESESMELMGKEFGGIPKVEPLVEKLNNVEKDLNDLKQVLIELLNPTSTPITEAGNGGPSGFQVAAGAKFLDYMAAQLIETQKNDIENPIVQHGKGR